MTDGFAARMAALGIPVQFGVPMARRTTIRVGGPAEFLVDARGERDIREVMQAARDADLPVLVIGNGSNLLVADEGIRGVVIAIGSEMASVDVHGQTMIIGAGAPLNKAAQAAQAAGLSGMEALSGIPGTIGGAAYMNAGAYGAEMAKVVTRVDALDQEGSAYSLSVDELDYGYRESALMSRGLIATRVTLALAPGDPEEIAAAMRAFAAQRREKQPLTLPSAGSFFKRPKGHFAGGLIEAAGLKGLSVGGAQVSEKHAGFLVNTGNATARDFLDLMQTIQARVLETSGVMLEPEVRILGCNSSC